MNKRAITASVAALAAIPALALAAGHPRPQFEGKAGKAVIGITVKGSGNHIKKVKKFEWDGFDCGSESFTGGTTKAIKVKDGKFEDTQPVDAPGIPLKVHVKGHFYANGTKAKGTMKVKSPCKGGTVKWTAEKTQQQQEGPQQQG
jgi:hypothetical protein